MNVVVTAEDQFFNVATSFNGTVALAIANNPGNPPGTLTGVTPVTAVNGVATFSGMSINKSGVGYTLRASSPSQPGLTQGTSTAFNITSGLATHLDFTVDPSNSGATIPFNPTVQVSGLDANDNIATSFTGAVTVAIGTNPPGNGILNGTKVVAAVGGTAAFPGLSIDKPGTGYTLVASSGVLTGAPSQLFNITTVGGTHLVFTAQPTTAQAGATISSPGGVQVTAQDSIGNTITSFTGNVTVAITAGTGTPGATLGGTLTVAAVGGTATFGNLNITRSGTGYTLTATAPGTNPPAISQAFNINAGPAFSLNYTGQPSNTAAGAAITPQVVVTAQDQFGNTATTFNGLVTNTFAVDPTGTATLSNPSVVASSGIANFSNLRINRPGTGFKLRAASGALVPDTSVAFNVTSTATQLAFTVQPTSPTQAGVVFSPTVTVTAQDSLGNTATGFSSNITVALFTNPHGGTLNGTKTIAAVGGIAQFSTINVDKVDVGYNLIATSGSLSPAFSNSFDIIPGQPSLLVFTGQPGNTQAGIAISPAVVVTVRDNQGNTVTNYSGSVTVAITPGTGTGGATLSGTTTQPVSGGNATFGDLNIDLSGDGYRLRATSAGVPGTFDSNLFAITGGMATQLFFTTQPTSPAAGIPINPSVVVTARDAQGNTASFTGNVTISIFSGPPGAALTPSSTPTVAAVGGIATFNNLRLNKTGGGYALHAAAGALAVNSTGFTVNPGGVSAGLSTVGVSPASLTASNGASQSTITVTARDTLGNLIPGANVVFSALPSPGNTLTPSATTDVNGVATGTLSSTASGTKTVSATINGVAVTQTQPVTVAPAGVSASTSTMSRLPTTIQASAGSIMSTMTVTARDQFSNVIPNATVVFGATGTGNTLNPNPPAGVLTNVSGVATGTLSSTVAELKVGSATIDGVPITPTVNITVTPAAAKVIFWNVQPNLTAAGAIIRAGSAVTVEVRDTFSNRVTTASNPVAMSILFNAGPGGVLSGTLTATNANGHLSGGIASFNDLSIDKAGVNYTLLASSAGLVSDTSAQFTITPGGATKLAFFTQPTNTTGGTAIPSFQVEVQDASGNRVTTASTSITLTIGTNPNSGALSGTTTVSAASGVATFSGVIIDSAGTGYTLNANGGGLTQATSTGFNVAVGSATKLGFHVQPANTTGGATLAAVQVEARDAGGNRVTSYWRQRHRGHRHQPEQRDAAAGPRPSPRRAGWRRSAP